MGVFLGFFCGFFFFLFFKYKNSQVSPPPKSLREVGAPPTFKVPSAGLGLLPEGPGKKQGAAPPPEPPQQQRGSASPGWGTWGGIKVQVGTKSASGSTRGEKANVGWGGGVDEGGLSKC